MWKYLKGVPPLKKRKADDEGVSAKMKKYDSSARMRTLQLSWIHGSLVGHGYVTIKLPARCIVMCAINLSAI